MCHNQHKTRGTPGPDVWFQWQLSCLSASNMISKSALAASIPVLPEAVISNSTNQGIILTRQGSKVLGYLVYPSSDPSDQYPGMYVACPPHLVPAGEQLRIRVAEEPAHVRPAERQACQPQGHEHGQRHLEVVPVRRVVAGPNRAHTLSAWPHKHPQCNGLGSPYRTKSP